MHHFIFLFFFPFFFYCFPTSHLWYKLLFGWHLVPATYILCAINILCTHWTLIPRRDGCIVCASYNSVPEQGEIQIPQNPDHEGWMGAMVLISLVYSKSTESIHCSRDYVQVLRHGRFVGDKETLENLGDFVLIIYLCGGTVFQTLGKWLGVCGVMP